MKLISKLFLENNTLQELFVDDQYKYFNEIDIVREWYYYHKSNNEFFDFITTTMR